jgi:predicted transcriptional regulator of viral defense system
MAHETKRWNLPQGRTQLVGLLSEARDVIHLDDVVSALPPDRTAAAERLSRWVEQGWLKRVGRGVYVAASIDTMG